MGRHHPLHVNDRLFDLANVSIGRDISYVCRPDVPLGWLLLQAVDILMAEEVIAVNQDDLGVAGDLIWKEGPNEVLKLLS